MIRCKCNIEGNKVSFVYGSILWQEICIRIAQVIRSSIHVGYNLVPILLVK